MKKEENLLMYNLIRLKKIQNTLVMMGISGMNAILFVDALRCYHLTINQEVKKSMITTMLNTKVMDKTFRQWFEHFVKNAHKQGASFHYVNEFGESVSRQYKMSDFDMDRIEKPNMVLLIKMVLQEYYKKKGFTN